MSCNICNKETFVNINFNTCNYCGFSYKLNIVSEENEKNRYLSHQYDANYKEYMKSLLNPYLSNASGFVLDFGCGQHPVLEELFCNLKFTNYDYYFFKDESYINKKYDIILLIEVIEHLKDPLSCLKGLVALLNENGKLIIHTKLSDNKDINNWWYTRDITHISIFNSRTFMYLEELLNMKCDIHDDFIIFYKN